MSLKGCNFGARLEEGMGHWGGPPGAFLGGNLEVAQEPLDCGRCTGHESKKVLGTTPLHPLLGMC